MRQITLFPLTFIILFLSTGCTTTTTHIIQPDETLHIKKHATLFRKDFQEVDISEFYTSGDSIIVVDYIWNDLLEFSKSDVTKIVVRNRFKGALQGAFIGAFGPSSLCYLICEDNPQDALGSKEAGAFMLFLLGGPSGAIIGFKEGSKDIYEFVTDRPSATENTDVDQTKPAAIKK